MTRTLLLVAIALAGPALAKDSNAVDLFTDKGDTFIKAGSNRGLKVGSEVQVLGDEIGDTGEYRPAGTATVMELWESIARVTRDDEAKKHPEAKRVRIAAPKAVAPAGPSHVESKPEAVPPALRGSASMAGIGPAKRISVTNSGPFGWTHCDLRLPNNRHYALAALKAGDTEGIIIQKFTQDGTEHDRPLDSLSVRCDQGAARLVFSL